MRVFVNGLGVLGLGQGGHTFVVGDGTSFVTSVAQDVYIFEHRGRRRQTDFSYACGLAYVVTTNGGVSQDRPAYCSIVFRGFTRFGYHVGFF